MTRRAAVLGRPVAHSLSPLLHRAAYAALGLDWTYEAIETGADDLAATLATRPDWAGFSCTMPLKRAALELAEEVTPLAAEVGAANTLTPRGGGGWLADNTDVAGVIGALGGIDTGAATVLGAGGAAQGVVVALARMGVDSADVLVRDRSRAEAVTATAEAVGIELRIGALDVGSAALSADLVVSTLPAGAADPFASAPWRAGQTLLDIVYDPWPTEMARAARTSGATVRGGGLMLLHQAAEQVRLMTGRTPPLEAMRAALRPARPDV